MESGVVGEQLDGQGVVGAEGIEMDALLLGDLYISAVLCKGNQYIGAP
jgi:hypothetical protein